MRYTKEQRDWIKSRPAKIQKVIKSHPPQECFVSTNINDGHYVIYSYDEEQSGKVSLQVIHTEYSFLPSGTLIFGVDPKTLKVCGCVNNAEDQP